MATDPHAESGQRLKNPFSNSYRPLSPPQHASIFDLAEPLWKRQQLADALFTRLETADMFTHYRTLQALRILTRDKKDLDRLFNADRLSLLLHMARLVGEEEAFMTENCSEFDSRLVVEAQKCICNLIFNSPALHRMCASNSCIDGIMLRLRMYKDPHLPAEVKYFDMRMLFILTALSPEMRRRVYEEYHGFIYLMEVIDLLLKQTAEPGQRPSKKSQRKRKAKSHASIAAVSTPPEPPNPIRETKSVEHELNDLSVEMCCEVLKVLFNLSYNIDKYNPDDVRFCKKFFYDDFFTKLNFFSIFKMQVEEAHFIRLVGILHDLLLTETKTKERRFELQNHIVNLFNNTPPRCYEELLVPIHEIGRIDNPKYEYEDMNVEALVVLLEFLDRRLDIPNPTARTLHESLSPILSCFCEMGRSNSTIRKYLRSQILPPLRDVMHRPEEGDTLRNKLVKLMTAPNTEIKELVAEYLFILCKENVGRLIKYTGYGNAAGLLANRGLMLGGRGRGNYSSDSDDSDTEEYLKMKDKINPVTGKSD